jgi:glutaminyl-tRNA synthetase
LTTTIPSGRPVEHHLHYASDYFDQLYQMAEWLIEQGYAYVDSQSAEDMAANRGNFSTPGTNSPFRNRPREESLQLFRDMKAGKYADGEHILRAKISEDAMASPNMNMRDPAIYRIRHAHHVRTGDAWCIYPMYDYTHPISDALENITHSICTLEFQDHRPFYDWLLEPCRRRLLQAAGAAPVRILAPEPDLRGHLQAQAAPAGGRKHRRRLGRPAHAHHRRPAPPRLHAGSDPPVLRTHRRDQGRRLDRHEHAGRLRARRPRPESAARHRRAAPAQADHRQLPEGQTEECTSPVHPHHPEMGVRTFPISRELWIEEEDFMEVPTKGYFRYYPPIGNRAAACACARLRDRMHRLRQG